MNQDVTQITPVPAPTATPAPTKPRARRLGVDGIIDRSQIDWYKDAIIYQMHVKAFFDSNNDGIGDFRGLIHKLDYIQDLGVTAIWILPFGTVLFTILRRPSPSFFKHFNWTTIKASCIREHVRIACTSEKDYVIIVIVPI
jgi:pullulanase/glycogen debranching enzyme